MLKSLEIHWIDITVAIFVVIMMLLPAQIFHIKPLNEGLEAASERISMAQSRITLNPEHETAIEHIEQFADLLGELGYPAWSIRVVAEAIQLSKVFNDWHLYRALATAYAYQRDADLIMYWMTQAFTDCVTSDSCKMHEQVRMSIYLQQIAAAIDSGLDPKRDPKGFRAIMDKTAIRYGIVKSAK